MSQYLGKDLEIAKLIGEPINTQLPVAVELATIADIFTAEAGEHVWRIQDLDETADVILAVSSSGVITAVKRTPNTDVELTFSGLNSKLEYVLLDDVLNKVDVNALARRKASIARGMNKRELKLIIDAILTPTSAVFPSNEVGGYSVTVESGDDIYDVFMKAKHGIEDYADGYKALVGTTVKEKIDTFDKDNASSFNYSVNISQKLASLGIEVKKVFGKVSTASNETESALLDSKKMILVGTNSSLAAGKPIQFVRRNINPQIAQQMGAEVDAMQRAVMVGQTPIQVPVSGTMENVLGYSVYGYESVVLAIKNPLAIATADMTSILS